MSEPTTEQQIRLLIRRGIMPSEAERIVTEAEELGLQTRGTLTVPSDDLQQQRAQAWWMYQDSVPHRFKRLLGAREHGKPEPVVKFEKRLPLIYC